MTSESVLFFVTELGRGGAETQLLRIALELRSRGWAVTVVSLMPPVGYADRLQQAGARVQSLDLRRGRPHPGALLRAISAIREARPRVVCCFLYHAMLLGALSAALAGRVPVVASIRDPSFGGADRLRLAAALHRLGLVRKTVANSQLVADALLASGSFRPSELEVIPNGLALSSQLLDVEQRHALRASLGIGDADFLWLHVGNFQLPKDHPNLLDAFGMVVSQRPHACLRLVGLGSPPEPIAERLSSAPLAAAVTHLGERTDVPSLLEAADALVLSSSSEGLPNVIMEAHAARTPVVSTNVGGVPELIQDAHSGLLARPRDPDALAQAMVRLMDAPPETRRAWASHGRAHVEASYDLGRLVGRWEDLFRSVADSTAR